MPTNKAETPEPKPTHGTPVVRIFREKQTLIVEANEMLVDRDALGQLAGKMPDLYRHLSSYGIDTVELRV
jgi:hypothetical protein